MTVSDPIALPCLSCPKTCEQVSPRAYIGQRIERAHTGTHVPPGRGDCLMDAGEVPQVGRTRGHLEALGGHNDTGGVQGVELVTNGTDRAPLVAVVTSPMDASSPGA